MSYQGKGLEQMETITNDMAGNLADLTARIQVFTSGIDELVQQATILPKETISSNLQDLLNEIEGQLRLYIDSQNEDRHKFHQAVLIFETEISFLFSEASARNNAETQAVRRFIHASYVIDEQITDVQSVIKRFLSASEQSQIKHKRFISYDELIRGMASELRQMLPLYQKTKELIRQARETASELL